MPKKCHRIDGPCRVLHANNKGADQPVHLWPLISIFVIPFIESHESGITSLSTGKITLF